MLRVVCLFFYRRLLWDDDDLCSHYISIDDEEERRDIAAPVLPVSSHGGKNSILSLSLYGAPDWPRSIFYFISSIRPIINWSSRIINWSS